MDSEKHAAFTGGKAAIQPAVAAASMAYDRFTSPARISRWYPTRKIVQGLGAPSILARKAISRHHFGAHHHPRRYPPGFHPRGSPPKAPEDRVHPGLDPTIWGRMKAYFREVKTIRQLLDDATFVF